MNEYWKTIDPAPTNYAVTADPNKPLRDARTVIRQLNDRIKTLEEQINTLEVESRIYRGLLRDVLNLKD